MSSIVKPSAVRKAIEPTLDPAIAKPRARLRRRENHFVMTLPTDTSPIPALVSARIIIAT